MAFPHMQLLNAFVQVNTIQGHRYLDDAGKIMNQFDKEFPRKEVGLEGLKMGNPDAKVRELRVTTEKVWVHIDEPDTLTYAVDHARNIIQQVAEIIAVKEFKRLGAKCRRRSVTQAGADASERWLPI